MKHAVSTGRFSSTDIVLWIRAAFRPAAVVFVAGWVFAIRGGLAGSLGLVAGMTTLACLLGALSGGIVGARPPLAGVTISALAAVLVAILMLDAGSPLREAALGPRAAEKLGRTLPWIAALATLAAFAGATGGLWLRRRWIAWRSDRRAGGPPR